MVKKPKPHSEVRFRTGRISIRVHPDLQDALQFLADRDHRALSNYVEMRLLDIARELIANPFTAHGERDDDDRPWALREDIQHPPSVGGGMRGFPPKKG